MRLNNDFRRSRCTLQKVFWKAAVVRSNRVHTSVGGHVTKERANRISWNREDKRKEVSIYAAILADISLLSCSLNATRRE